MGDFYIVWLIGDAQLTNLAASPRNRRRSPPPPPLRPRTATSR